uniref:Uncharacterized protein n=1 Tax=Neogobius melanostomus TaxID=47308 RepID=A0A8C6U9X9_9GOBI
MATAICQLSEDQFFCSICLEVFTDPVTLPCGHNFCKECIDKHWSADAKCQCPSCKHIFHSRPELKTNTVISEVVDQFRQSHLQSTASPEAQAVNHEEVLCDACTGPKQRALKSCLVCLSSYCESHLELHLNMLGLRKHQLVEPKKDLEERVCREHDKPFELFCQSDQQTVCVQCLGSDHKDHKIIPLKEASKRHRLQLQKTESHCRGPQILTSFTKYVFNLLVTVICKLINMYIYEEFMTKQFI